jgi:hypothetical protein
MSDRERGTWIYVTSDSQLWLKVDLPFGLIAPPTIDLHRPMVGLVKFYHADSYQLPVPAEARSQPD